MMESNGKDIVAVLGCGHGGQALAARLAQLGLEVRLFAYEEHPGSLRTIQRQGGIYLRTTEMDGLSLVENTAKEKTDFVSVSSASSHLNEAIFGAKYIFITLPAHVHQKIFIDLLPHLEKKQTVVTFSSHFSGILFERLMIKNTFVDINIVDVSSFPWICRSIFEGEVNVVASKKRLLFSAQDIITTQMLKNPLEALLGCEMKVGKNFLEIGLYDPSGITHPANVIFNAVSIERGESFYFYKEGVSLGTCRYLQTMDKERLAIGELLGFNLPSYIEVMNEYYGFNYKNIYEFFTTSPYHNQLCLCPDCLACRYIREDVPYCLVPWYTLGKALGYEASAMRNVIGMASILNSEQYLDFGLTIGIDEVEKYRLCG